MLQDVFPRRRLVPEDVPSLRKIFPKEVLSSRKFCPEDVFVSGYFVPRMFSLEDVLFLDVLFQDVMFQDVLSGYQKFRSSHGGCGRIQPASQAHCNCPGAHVIRAVGTQPTSLNRYDEILGGEALLALPILN
jgi:hypothetical protein